ncbi:MAG: GNAT family N-acetyltransferase [Dehalococcoidia bacterium]
MSGHVERRVINPATDAAWSELVCGAGQDSLFVAPPWFRAVANSYDLEPRADLILEDGRPTAGIAYAEIDDPRGKRIVSFPFADYCDPVAASPDAWATLIEPLVASGAPVSVKVLECEAPLHDERFEATRALFWHRTAIAADEDAQWSQLGGTARRNISKARGNALEIERRSDLEALRAFYELHTGVRKHKYRLLPQPWRFFEELHRQFGERLQVLLARNGDEVAGGVVLFAWGDTLYYKFNASDPAHLEHRPNDLLAWETINLARALGLQWLDWGVSDDDQPGLIRYKQKFATEERHATIARTRAASVDPNAAHFGAVLGELTALLTDERVPNDVTQRAGDLLYGYFG